MDIKTAFAKACRYCAYQERTQAQVREKLHEWQLWDDAIEEVIVKLSQEGFLSEERFAKAYASGKFRQLKWGRVKIKYGLKQHGLSDYCIKKGMAEIDSDEYIQTLEKLAAQKWDFIKEKSPLKKMLKIKSYLASKGYEHDLIAEIINARK